jgi:hypothetical protein
LDEPIAKFSEASCWGLPFVASSQWMPLFTTSRGQSRPTWKKADTFFRRRNQNLARTQKCCSKWLAS